MVQNGFYKEEKGRGKQTAEPDFRMEIKNKVDVLQFKDPKMQQLAKGWLTLESANALRADILMPACRYDCRVRMTTSE